MDINIIAMQPGAVTAAVKGFLVNLSQAVGIVFIVLLVFMGVRSGLIIGSEAFVREMACRLWPEEEVRRHRLARAEGSGPTPLFAYRRLRALAF